MYINSDRRSANFGEITLYVNSYHVQFTHKDGRVFSRSPQNEDWLDEPHKRVTRALDELEAAIRACFPEG